jgi:hypothetical protein
MIITLSVSIFTGAFLLFLIQPDGGQDAAALSDPYFDRHAAASDSLSPEVRRWLLRSVFSCQPILNNKARYVPYFPRERLVYPGADFDEDDPCAAVK